MTSQAIDALRPGMPILYGGNRLTLVSPELAAAFRPGDRLVVVQSTGALLHIPAEADALVASAVARARSAFAALASIPDTAIATFFESFARRLADDAAFGPIAIANAADVTSARERGRSTTRLELNESMRRSMIAGLRAWIDLPSGRGDVVARVDHGSWQVEQVRSGLGVVGFVFEGRPNVFADAAGVVRSGNTAVFRIGSDALGTARAIVAHAAAPALADAGLPAGTLQLIDAPSRATGWALFDHPGLSLAVARGSGGAVAELGAVARQAGTPVSLHGTGGGWLIAGRHASAARFEAAVRSSLDRKVCNTLNVCCIPAERAAELVPVALRAIDAAAAARGTAARLHVLAGGEHHVPSDRFTDTVDVVRAEGVVAEPGASSLPEAQLGHEWEWEGSPELTLAVVADVDRAIDLFNVHSPRLVASVVTDDDREYDAAFERLDAPFVGNGFTRWVDGQFALGTPELGLSNWQDGRLFARSGVLAGDGVFTVRMRAWQRDPDLAR